MQSTSHAFKENAHEALADARLQKALGKMKVGFQDKRLRAVERLPEFDALRDQARDIKNHALEHLDFYLERFESKVTDQGGNLVCSTSATLVHRGPAS